MSALRPFIGALALTALLAARTAPVVAEELVLSAAANLGGDALVCAAPAPDSCCPRP